MVARGLTSHTGKQGSSSKKSISSNDTAVVRTAEPTGMLKKEGSQQQQSKAVSETTNR